jgi:hypothetical protein
MGYRGQLRKRPVVWTCVPRWGLRLGSAWEKRIAQRICELPGFGARLLEGEGASEPGQRASSVRTGGGAGPRAARERPGRRSGTEEAGAGKKKEKEGDGHRQVGRAGGMTEKERMTENRRND